MDESTWRDDLWFYTSTVIICFFVLQVVGIPLSFIPLIVLVATFLLALVALIIGLVTLPRRLWGLLRHPTE